MQFFRLVLISVVVLALVNPTEAWRRLRRAFKKVGKSIRRVIKKVKEPIKKLGCKIIFGIGCPVAVSAAAVAVTGGSGGLGTAVGALGAAAGKNACHTRKRKCKRSVVSNEILFPISDDFTDYDHTKDKLISYEEFVFTIMEHFPMAAPEELREPFIFADANDDDYMDMDEFKGAPFLFAHFNPPPKLEVNQTMPAVNQTDTFSNDTLSPAA